MTSKEVIHTNMYAYPVVVYNCPRDKRIWKSGSRTGQSFASVYDDCYNCPFGKVRKKIKNFNNQEIECGQILSVDCSSPISNA